MPAAAYTKVQVDDGSFVFVASADIQVAAIPIGTIWEYAAATPPTGWILCDGTSYLRTLYQNLFAIIGTTWGSADGTHFNVPDLRGKSPVGAGTGTGLTARALAAVGGEEAHLLTTQELAQHHHTSAAHTHPAASGNFVSTATASNAGLAVAAGGVAQANTGSTTPGNTGDTPGTATTAHNTMHPFAVVTYMIKY